MNTETHLTDCRDGEPLLPIEHRLTDAQRRPLTVQEHHQFRQDMASRLEQLEEAAALEIAAALEALENSTPPSKQ